MPPEEEIAGLRAENAAVRAQLQGSRDVNGDDICDPPLAG
jgi:hypothetical protein